MIPEPGDPNREVPVNKTFHVQTDDELTENELKQIEADDQAIQTILLSLPEDIYAAVDSCESAQEIWLRVQQMMKGSDIRIQEKKAKLFNDRERLSQPRSTSRRLKGSFVIFGEPLTRVFGIRRFSDADYAGCKDTFKSTSGGAQFLGEKLVSWSSKKQDCTALSTAEAEYVSLSTCCAQVLWMRTQLTDYGFHLNKIPIYCDSKSAIAISCNPVQHSRTKHIAVRYHFIKEHVEKAILQPGSIFKNKTHRCPLPFHQGARREG
nr:copia protein [Tanacetum cinerariifolium]